ncbi:MAG: two-component regulator propeller domain-containing protein, partial [Paludibacter sp.]
MWFGTYDGLCRYDGFSIKTFKKIGNSSDAFHNHISALYCNSYNQLFVGTRKGLHIFNKKDQSFLPVAYHEFDTQASKQSSVEITAIIGNNEKVFIATLGEGLLEYDNEKKSFVQVELLNNEHNLYIHSIAFSADNNQSVFLGIDDKGIYKYNYKTKVISLTTDKVTHTLSLLESDNKLYIGTNNGLLTFNGAVQSDIQSQKELRSPIQFLKKDLNGVIWVGTENKGLLLIDARNNSIQHISAGYKSSMLSSEGLYCMHTDKSNYVWLGTMRGGINVWNLKSKEFQSRKNYLADNPASNFINCFLEISPNIIWVGTDGGGIQQYNQLTDQFEYSSTANKINKAIGNTVISIKKDKAGNIWLGTYGSGLFKYNKNRNSIKQYTTRNSNLTSNNIWCMYIDRKENLWIGAISSGGLFKYSYSQDSFEKMNVNTDNVLTINEDNQRRLMIGNYSGFTIFNPTNNTTQYFATNVPVRSIHQDKENNLWIGTEGSGLLNLNIKSGKITAANHMLDYLKESSIMSIAEDDRKNLWISTSNGLLRYHYTDKQLTTYNKNDGLQDKQFNYSSFLQTSNNYFYFGGINGFTLFQPSRISTQSASCPFHITDVFIHNTSIYSEKDRYSKIIDMLTQNKIKLKYEDAYLRFDFIAISYNNPEKVIYTYMLEGIDKTWIFAGNNRSANYSGLSPGNYTFKLKYATEPYQWKEDQIIEIKVKVSPPFYLTWWAFIIYFTFAGIIIYAIIYVQKRQNRLKHELLLSDMKEEQAIQAQQMREQFFINISHELRTPLTLIIPPIKDSLMTTPFKPINKVELQT